MMTETFSSDAACSTRSGSGRRSRIWVASSSAQSRWCIQPHAWNRGAAIRWVSRCRNGKPSIRAITASIGAPVREAPRGTPVVPLVRITWRPVVAGFSGDFTGPVAKSSQSPPARVNVASAGHRSARSGSAR